jgi:hypothetical protein
MSLPEPEASLETYQSPRTLAKVVTGAFFVYLAADIWAVLLSVQGLDIIGRLKTDGDVGGAELLTFVQRLDNLVPVMYGALAVIVVAFCMWTHRVATNAVAFGSRRMTTPGWAVGYYFIPILNLWRPYQAIGDVWRDSDPNAPSDDSFSSLTAPLPWFFIVWWLSWIASGIFERVATRMLRDVSSLDDMTTGFRWLLYAVGIDLFAGILCLTVVWKLTGRQEKRAPAAMPAARVVDPNG